MSTIAFRLRSLFPTMSEGEFVGRAVSVKRSTINHHQYWAELLQNFHYLMRLTSSLHSENFELARFGDDDAVLR